MKRIITAALALFTIACSAQDAPIPREIFGTVRTIGDKPIDGALVRAIEEPVSVLSPMAPQNQGEAVTQPDGTFRIRLNARANLRRLSLGVFSTSMAKSIGFEPVSIGKPNKIVVPDDFIPSDHVVGLLDQIRRQAATPKSQPSSRGPGESAVEVK